MSRASSQQAKLFMPAPKDAIGADYHKSVSTGSALPQEVTPDVTPEMEYDFAFTPQRPSSKPALSRTTSLHASDHRFAISLAMGLLAGLGLSVTSSFTYLASGTLTLSGSTLPDEQVAQHGLLLAQQLEQANKQRGSHLTIMLPQISDHDEIQTVELRLMGFDKDNSIAFLNEIKDNYIEQHTQARNEQSHRLLSQVQMLDEQIGQNRVLLEKELLSLAEHQSQLAMSGEEVDLQSLLHQLTSSRSEFDHVQQELDAAASRFNQLQMTLIPDAPEVDRETRMKEESRDAYLQQDLAALENRLQQVKNKLLDASRNTGESIRKLHASTRGLASYLETQKLNLTNHEMLTGMDTLISQANNLSQKIEAYLKTWNRVHHNLSNLTISPHHTHCLELQSAIEILVKDLRDDSRGALSGLQSSYRQFTQTIDVPAEHFNLQNGIIQRVKEVVQAQYVLSEEIEALLPESHFQLEAVVHSAIGLTRRVKDRRLAIENRLIQDKKNQMEAELATSITREHQFLGTLQIRREQLLRHMLGLHEHIDEAVHQLETSGENRVSIVEYQHQTAKLKGELEQLQTERERLTKEMADCEESRRALDLATFSASASPTNLFDRISKITMGSVVAILLTYCILQFTATRPRRPSDEPLSKFDQSHDEV